MMLTLAALENATQWSALEPDNVTPSPELTVTSDVLRFRFGPDNQSMRMNGSINATQRRARLNLAAPLNLDPYEELRFWIWSNRTADGSVERPFFLEMRMGSAALTIDAVGNTWLRAIPISSASRWELVSLSFEDLPGAVQGAVNAVEIRCVGNALPFVCNFDDFAAVQERMIGDVDDALILRLDQQISFGLTQVRARLAHPEHPPAVTEPYILVRQYDIRYNAERTLTVDDRSDFSGSGFRLRRPPAAYDIYYSIDVVTASRAQKSQVMEFILASLSPVSGLLVNNLPLTVDWIGMTPADPAGQLHDGRELLCFKVASRQRVAPLERVLPPTQIQVEVEQFT